MSVITPKLTNPYTQDVPTSDLYDIARCNVGLLPLYRPPTPEEERFFETMVPGLGKVDYVDEPFALLHKLNMHFVLREGGVTQDPPVMLVLMQLPHRNWLNNVEDGSPRAAAILVKNQENGTWRVYRNSTEHHYDWLSVQHLSLVGNIITSTGVAHLAWHLLENQCPAADNGGPV